jgi:hypothetical protein
MGGRGGSRTLSRPFGRDALITSLQLLPVRPQMAQATLRALAERQGREAHPGTQEEPGKIGHEFRPSAPQSLLDAGWPEAGDFRYYGRGRHKLVLRRAGEDARRAARPRARAGMARGGRLDRPYPRFRRRPAASRPGVVSRRPQRAGWRDTIDPTRSGGGGVLRADVHRPAAAARRPGYPSRDRIGAAGPGRAVGRGGLASASRGAPGATLQGLRSQRDGAGGRRSAGSRRGVPARMAAVGRCA